MDVDTKHGISKIVYTHSPNFNMGGRVYMIRGDYAWTAPVFFKVWRVVAFGLYVLARHGTSGTTPKTNFGLYCSDVGVFDTEYWGSISQDGNSGKPFTIGDMFVHDPLNFLCKTSILAQHGTPTVVTTDHFLEWQTTSGVSLVYRMNDFDLDIQPFLCIEIRK